MAVLLVLLGLHVNFSVPSREIGWEERLRGDFVCVERDVKRCSIHPRAILEKILPGHAYPTYFSTWTTKMVSKHSRRRTAEC